MNGCKTDETCATPRNGGRTLKRRFWLLPSVSIRDRKQLPNKPGVYFAVSRGEILYIGMAGKQGLRSRWTDNAGWGEHKKLKPLLAIDRDRPVRLLYWIRPLWRVEHDEAVEIRRFIGKHGELPLLNKKVEDTVWWVALYDYLKDCAAIAGVILGILVGLKLLLGS